MMESITSQPSVDSTPAVSAENPQSSKSNKIFIALVVLLCAILVSVIFFIIYQLKKPAVNDTVIKNQSSPVPVAETKKANTYTNKDWGYTIQYPPGWYVIDYGDGFRSYVSSYNGTDVGVWHVPKKNELKISIEVEPKDKRADFIDWSATYSAQKNLGPKIGGEPSTKIVRSIPFWAGEQEQIRKEQATPDQVGLANETTEYIVLHDGYTYRITAQPTDTLFQTELQDFLASFQFSKRRTYASALEAPQPGMTRTEDKIWGYAFDTPTSVPLNAYGEPQNFITLVPVTGKKSGDFVRDMAEYLIQSCGSDGPNGSTSCQEGSAKLTEFTNTNGIKGYKATRTKIDERYLENEQIETKTEDKLVIYPLSSSAYFAVMFSSFDPKNTDLVQRVADTFRYLKEE